MRYDQVVRAKDGRQRRVENVKDICVPDIWKITEGLSEEDQAKVLEVWYLAHDLLKHVRRIFRPIVTDGPGNFLAEIIRKSVLRPIGR